jgi:hypothetical protein
LYSRWESNPHFRKNWILNPARLPIPPLEQVIIRIAKLLNILVLKVENLISNTTK